MNRDAKAKAAKRENKVRKEELVDLLGPEVGNKYYNDQLQYDRYCGKMLNKRAESRITNCDIRSRIDYIHTNEAELGINLDISLSKQDPLDKLNDLANKKRKHVDDIHDYFKANKRLKYKDFPEHAILYTPYKNLLQDSHQGPRLDDHARTFSTLLLAEIDKRNLNPLKQMRTIKQLRQIK
ncbi:hypothetical protein Tco_0697082 [Tanacetum coccineum]